MKNLSIEEMWNEYAKRCVPIQASPGQIRQTRLAFYAGFISLYEVVVMLGSREVPTEAGVMALEMYKIQIARFMEEVEKLRQRPASDAH